MAGSAPARAKSPKPKDKSRTISSIDAAIGVFNAIEDTIEIVPAKGVFGSVATILGLIRDKLINDEDLVGLAEDCIKICEVFRLGIEGKNVDDLSNLVQTAIADLEGTTNDIEQVVKAHTKRNSFVQVFHAKYNKEKIQGWKQGIQTILCVFNASLNLDTNIRLTGIEQRLGGLTTSSGTAQATCVGESPPHAPRLFLGRDELVKEILSLVVDNTPVALIGPGGAGKSSLALTVLHHERTKQKFGDERRFMRCDKLQVSYAHFLNRLSHVVGAGIENPPDLAKLQPYLSSKSIFLVLDNAETILDPGANDAGDIYRVVDGLRQFTNIYTLITSRISTLPPVKQKEMPSLPRDAASKIFCSIRGVETASAVIGGLLENLEFHALSITLLATAALQNRWDDDRLAREWEKRRTGILANRHSKDDAANSLPTTINLSLASPMFVALGGDARGVLEIIAFFPQGADEEKLEWVFPGVARIQEIVDAFCMLSLTHRTGSFVTMLAPLRDHLLPSDPCSAPLLLTAKAQYFARLDLMTEPLPTSDLGFSEALWILSEGTNVEHLLDVFTSRDADSEDVWRASHQYILHLVHLDPHRTILSLRIAELPGSHPWRAACVPLVLRLNHAAFIKSIREVFS